MAHFPYLAPLVKRDEKKSWAPNHISVFRAPGGDWGRIRSPQLRPEQAPFGQTPARPVLQGGLGLGMGGGTTVVGHEKITGGAPLGAPCAQKQTLEAKLGSRFFCLTCKFSACWPGIWDWNLTVTPKALALYRASTTPGGK